MEHNENTTGYLYGASVQGIQGFIFGTNELKDIVGASELVERICTEMFDEFKVENGRPVVNAAGNIKYVFGRKEDCGKAVLEFPKRVLEAAPGITISQAVVEMKGRFADFKSAVEELERRLRAQRNCLMKSLTTGLMAMERSRKTGLPAVKAKNGDYLDEGTLKKTERATKGKSGGNTTLKLCEKITGDKGRDFSDIAFNLKDLTVDNDWIAIIHADGNGLGEVVARIGSDPERLREFSANLDKSTIEAAKEAYKAIAGDDENSGRKLPIRPVVLGGDDLTVICRADMAVDFVKKYLEYFEEETEKKLRDGKLTACAGIAFIKSSYPFYYGYDLAEMLCSSAKVDAKSDKMKNANGGKAPSCLMFHKVQSSFVEDYSEIKRKELTAEDGSSYVFGPYYLNGQEGRWTIDKLQDVVSDLAKEGDGNAAKTDIREWLTIMANKSELATQKEQRVNSIGSREIKRLFNAAIDGNKREGKNCYPAYDILSLLTIESQVTK